MKSLHHFIIITCTSLVFFFTGFAKEYPSPFQPYFKVNSPSSLVSDSMYYACSKGNKDLATAYYNRSKETKYKPRNNNDSMGYFLSRGLTEYLANDFPSAFKSLVLCELIAQQNNDAHYGGIVNNHLGNVYYLTKDKESALSYYQKVVANEKAPTGARSSAMNNISVVTYELYLKTDDSILKDSFANIIDHNYYASMKIQKETGDYSNMAGTMSVMIPWFASRQMFDSAFHYADLCRNLAREHQLSGRLAFLRISLTKIYIAQKRFNQAIDTCQLAIEFYQKDSNTDQEIHALSMQAQAYDSLGLTEKSKMNIQRMFYMQQENFNKQKAESMGKYEADFNLQKKELENQRLITENKTKKLQFNNLLLALITLAGIMAAGLLVYRNKIKQKQIELKSQEVHFKNQMLKSNMESEEKERKKIARELHDGVGQQISSIKLGLDNIGQTQAKTDLNIAQLKDMVATVLDSVRGISHQMMPVALQRFGLVKAVESLVFFLKENSEVNYFFEDYTKGNPNLNETDEVHIYRIIQELTNNINKHSKAKTAHIMLNRTQDNLLLVISDDGVGFTDADQYKISLGMMNIQSRVEAMNGNLNIESKPGETTFQIKIPLS